MSKGIKFRKNGEYVYPCPFYPVGSIYESTSNTNPTNYFGGTWECIYNDYDYICLGSQVVHPGIQDQSLAGGASRTVILQGAYTNQFLHLEYGMSCPPGYVFKYRFTAEMTSNGNLQCCIRVNGVNVTDAIGTWSGELFRETLAGGFYRLGTDITPQPTSDIGYSRDGYVYSLYAINNASGTQAFSVWDVTAHLFAVSKNKIYKWRRTA